MHSRFLANAWTKKHAEISALNHLAADLLTQVYCYTDTFVFFCAFHFSRMQQTPVVSLNGIFYQWYWDSREKGEKSAKESYICMMKKPENVSIVEKKTI